jgi:metal-sulfur cluster biosynthetic enzyme
VQHFETIIEPFRGHRIVSASALVVMTMTSPTCPLGELLASEARTAIRRGVPELEEVEVRIVLSPAWHAGLMSEAARRRLGWG